MKLNLNTPDLALRVDDCTPYHLLEALREITGLLTETEAYATDYLLQAWTLRACLTGDFNAIEVLDTTLGYLQEREPREGLRAKWATYQGILASRALLLIEDSDIRELLQDQAFPALLAELPSTGQFVEQETLPANAQYSPERLSQLLGSLSDYGLVEARLRHKTRDWRITPLGLRWTRTAAHQDA